MTRNILLLAAAASLIGSGVSSAQETAGQNPLDQTVEILDQYRMLERPDGEQVCEYRMFEAGSETAEPLLIVQYERDDPFYDQCRERSALASIPSRTISLAELSPCNWSGVGSGVVVGGSPGAAVVRACPIAGEFAGGFIPAAPLVLLGLGAAEVAALGLGAAAIAGAAVAATTGSQSLADQVPVSP